MTFTEWLQEEINKATREINELGKLEETDISEWVEVNNKLSVLYKVYGKYMSLN